MIRILINWYKMKRLIESHRKDGNASFYIVTTDKELVIVAEDNRPIPKFKSKQIRLRY